VLAAEHLARLRAFDFLLQLVERAGEIALTSSPRRPFDQHADVVGAALSDSRRVLSSSSRRRRCITFCASA
jgi:hypothetical protein